MLGEDSPAGLAMKRCLDTQQRHFRLQVGSNVGCLLAVGQGMQRLADRLDELLIGIARAHPVVSSQKLRTASASSAITSSSSRSERFSTLNE